MEDDQIFQRRCLLRTWPRWPVWATRPEIGEPWRPTRYSLLAIHSLQSTTATRPLLPEGAPHAPQPAVDLRLPDFGPARRPRARLQVRRHRHQRAALPAASGILAGDG